MALETYPVVIMAGGHTPEKILASGETEKERAFVKVGGRPMLAWVLEAVRNSRACAQILCIGNVERMINELGLKPEETASDLGSMLENFVMAMQRFRHNKRVMVTTCDIPLITSQMLDDLAAQVSTIEADFYYPIINVKLYDEKFPGGRRTTQKLKEGTFTGGNVFFLNPDAILRNRQRVESVIRYRKSPAKLVQLFGLPFIIKFALRQLDLPGLEKKATEIMGAKMKSVITPYPEIGFDVDKPEDLKMVRSIMGNA